MKLNSIFLPLLAIASLQVAAQPKKHNILLIQVDDMGFDDLSCNGNTVSKTPNLDAFSKTAVRFGNFMVCNVCSPARASLLTGRDFWRTGVSGMHGGNDFMNLDEKTSSEILAYGASKTFGVENEDHQITGWDKAGDYAEYKMMVYQSGVYSILVKSKKANLKGITFNVSCDGNESISGKMIEKNAQIGLLKLSAGEHTLKLEIAAIEDATKPAAIDIESLQLDLDDDFMGLSDPKATNETVALFSNLKKIGRAGIIFGHHFACNEAQGWKNSNFSADLKSDCNTSVGDHPGIIGFDLGRGTSQFKDYSEEIFRRGGISTYSWHCGNPVTGGSFKDTTGYAVASILAGGKYMEVWKKKLDEVADLFNSLEVNGVKVPVIFRPFHENTGKWFWWGAGNCTSQQYIDLWRLTIDYLRNEKGVHNMLVAYSPSKPSINVALAHDMYPGDDYVDIIGFDAYQTDEALKPLIIDGARLVCEWAKASHKVPAMTEIGIKSGLQNSTSTDWFMSGFLDLFKNDEAGKDVAYVLTWKNSSPDAYWVPLPGQPNYESFVNFYKDPTTYFLRDLKNIYVIAGSPDKENTPSIKKAVKDSAK